MNTNYTNRNLKKFRINYYLQPLVFDLLYSLFTASFGSSKTLISHRRWCSTEEENKLRDEFGGTKNNIFRVVASHQNHKVAFDTISEQLWVTFLDCRECGRCVEDLVKGVGPLQINSHN